ncbi:MAG: DUF1207 domain-containing protein [Planctomycetes bacterium]|nr:DUF1207 domain-containing protein [Planctomycetota bacterium]
MPRCNARVASALRGRWAPSCVHWSALLVCLTVAGQVMADGLVRRLPPIGEGAFAGQVLWANSASPIHLGRFLEREPGLAPASGLGEQTGASLLGCGARMDRNVMRVAAFGPPTSVAYLNPPDDGPLGVPPGELFADDVPLRARDDGWTLQVMPAGLLYRSYMAGAKEPRFAGYWNHDKNLGQIWDTALGGRLGLFRYGTGCADHPEGFQVDMEGGAQARLDPQEKSTMLLSVDFRLGIPITYAKGRWQFKTGYYHVSCHLGDEFLQAFPDAPRIDYSRDAILLGAGYFWTERLRLYGETARAITPHGGAKPWEFQFGADWAPGHDTGILGSPFAAVNVHLREEVDFGGNFVVQAGWAWRRCPRGSCYRIGFEYFNGKSDQYEYFDRTEERLGWGIWVDF